MSARRHSFGSPLMLLACAGSPTLVGVPTPRCRRADPEVRTPSQLPYAPRLCRLADTAGRRADPSVRRRSFVPCLPQEAAEDVDMELREVSLGTLHYSGRRSPSTGKSVWRAQRQTLSWSSSIACPKILRHGSPQYPVSLLGIPQGPRQHS